MSNVPVKYAIPFLLVCALPFGLAGLRVMNAHRPTAPATVEPAAAHKPDARLGAPATRSATVVPSAQARYLSCVDSVETDYRSSWANACVRICMAAEGSCAPDCLLPTSLASNLSAALEKGRDRCLQEVSVGLR